MAAKKVAKKGVSKADNKGAGKGVKRAAKKSVKKAVSKSSKKSPTKSAPSSGTTALLPKGVSQPATRALATIGVTKVDQLTKHREADVAVLHGMGPKALGILKAELEATGKSFKP